MAIIAWNTLQAKLWDVNQTKLDGEVSLGNTANTLLNTHFRSYCFDGDLKEVKNVTVADVPSTDSKIGDRQIRLNITESDDTDFDYEATKAFDKIPSKNDETATYKEMKDVTVEDSDGKTYETTILASVVAYVPEGVYDDIESLLGRKVTVIFGDDNVVALVIVEDDVVNNEYATKFDGEKLTIGNDTYRFATEFELYVNNTKVNLKADEDDLADVLNNILRGTYSSSKTFEKNIKANVVLNSKGKVSRLDLFVSGNYPEYNTYETVVGKVKNTVIYDTDESTKLYDYDEDNIDEDDLAKVYVNGAKASVEDIVAGDVLTIYYNDANNNQEYNQDEATTIYVSRETVEGVVSRIKNVKDIVIDGTTYVPSVVKAENVLLLDDADFEDAEPIGSDDDKLRNLVDEDATLYTNIYGEYVLVASEASGMDYTFGILKSLKDPEEEENSVYTQKLSIFVGNSSSMYTLIYDDEEYEDDADRVANPDDTLIDATAGTPIAFIANADKEIDFEDIVILAEEGDFSKYIVIDTSDANIDITKVDFDNERIVIDDTSVDNEKDGTYRFKSSSTILNAKEKDGVSKPEKLAWKGLVVESPEGIKDDEDIIIVCEKDTTVISYIFVNLEVPAETTSDYAVVTKHTESDSKKTYAYLMDSNGDEIDSLEDKNAESNKFINYIVEYKTSGSKLTSIYPLLDVDAVIDLTTSDEVEGLYATEGTVKLLADYVDVANNAVTSAQKTVCEKCFEKDTHATTCALYNNNTVTPDACEKCFAKDTHTEDCDLYNDNAVTPDACEKCFAKDTHTEDCDLYNDNAVTPDACGVCFQKETHDTDCTGDTDDNGTVDEGEKTVCAVCHQTTTHAEGKDCYDDNAVESAEKTVCAVCHQTTTHAEGEACYDDNAVESAEKTACADCHEKATHKTTCGYFVADTIATLDAFMVDEIENTLIIYKDADPIRLDAVNVPKDKSEVTVFNIDEDGTVSVSSYDKIEKGNIVFAFGTGTEATLLVVMD